LRKLAPYKIQNREHHREANNLRQYRNDESIHRNWHVNQQRYDDNRCYREGQIETQKHQIHWKKLGSDQFPSKRQTVMILPVSARHGHRIAMLLEKCHHLFIAEWATKSGLLLFYL